MASEDMAYFLEKAPGCFFFVGSGSGGDDPIRPPHTSTFDIDERSLAVGCELMANLALNYPVSE